MDKNKVIIGFFILVFLALYTSVVFSFFNVDKGPRMMYMLLMGIPPAVLLMLFPRAAFIIFAFLICSVRWMYDWLQILPREATWLSDILIAVLIVRTILWMVYQRKPFAQIEKLILLFVAFAIFSALANHVSRESFIAGMRFGFRYVLLFVAACQLDVTPKWLRGYIGLLFFFAAAQFPVLALQFKQVGWHDPDRTYGTFGIGGTTAMGLFMLVLVIYILSRILEDNKIRFSHIVIVSFLSIPPILGEVKFYFLFMPVLLAVMMRKTLRKKPGVALGVFVLTVILIGSVDYFVKTTKAWRAQRSPFKMFMTIPQQFRHGMATAEQGRYDRVFQYAQAIKMTVLFPKKGIIGYGVGSVTDSYAFKTMSPTLAKFSQWQMTSKRTMGFIWLLLEYGIIGMILIFRLLWLIFCRARILIASDIREERIYGRLLEGITITFFIWNFYGPAWQLDSISFSFWPLAGMIVGLSYQVEARRKLAVQKTPDLRSSESPIAVPAI